jgi:hypothetical protein
MKPWLARLIRIALTLALTWVLARAWFQSALSERLWTWINWQFDAGARPGLASDIETVLVLVVSLAVSVCAVLLLRGLRRRLSHQQRRP